MKNNMMIVIRIQIQILTKIIIIIIIIIQIAKIQIKIQIIPTKIRTLILYPELTKIFNKIPNLHIKQNNNKLKPFERIVETYKMAPIEIIKEI
jgi:hypothetical protein